MKKLLRNNFHGLFALLLFGCDGFTRSCSSSYADEFGADWVVVQFDDRGQAFNCWKLSDVSISNETGTDGIYWLAEDNHLVHISGWYNRVQVAGGNYKGAAKALGIDIERCDNGAYAPQTPATP